MNYVIQKRWNKIPEKLLLADLRKTAKKLGKKQLGYGDYEKAGKFFPGTVAKKFGSWNIALIKAGLKIKKVNRYSDEALLENLKNVWDTLCRQPSSTEMVKPLSRFNRTAYKRRFGSWYGALSVLVKEIKAGKFKSPERTGEKRALSIKQISLMDENHLKNTPDKEPCVSKSMRFDIFKRDNFRCRICGASPANDLKVKLHVDHIIPAAKGGKTVLLNLQTLCSDCNYGKSSKSMSNEQ